MSETIQATVLRIRFHNTETGFTVLLAAYEESRAELTIIGSFPPVEEGEDVVGRGDWRQDRRWGRQFAAESVMVVTPTSREGIEAYLAAGHVKGIGRGLARRLLDHFDTELLQIVDREPSRLLDVAGVGKVLLQGHHTGRRGAARDRAGHGTDSAEVRLQRPARRAGACPDAPGAIGIDSLNRDLQRALNPPEGHKVRIERPNGVVFLPRDKVMQTVNNYEKEVFNGDVGVVATIDVAKKRFTVDFGADLIAGYTFDEADQLALAYATTIHKSQGSEYQAVIVVLMPQHHIMLRRNLLYTAVTRGRRLVVLVGDMKSVQTAVRTGRGGERCTRLRHCLGATPLGHPPTPGAAI